MARLVLSAVIAFGLEGHAATTVMGGTGIAWMWSGDVKDGRSLLETAGDRLAQNRHYVLRTSEGNDYGSEIHQHAV